MPPADRPNNPGRPGDDTPHPLAEYWNEAFDRAIAALSQSPQAGVRPGALDSAEAFFHEYLSSPLFLEAMKQRIDLLISTRREYQRLEEPSPLWDDHMKSCWVGQRPDGQSVAEPDAARERGTPADVVFRGEAFAVKRFRSDSPRAFAEPVLICFSLINRPYILDLNQRVSVVRRLLEAGFDVYLIDWNAPTDADRGLGLDDYARRYLGQAVEAVCSHAGCDRLHLLGYCLGGTLSVIYGSLRPGRLRSLTLLAAPIDFSGDRSLLNLWARQEYFDADGLVAAFGNCPGFFLRSCFQLMKPAANLIEKHLRLAENLDKPAYCENFMAMERWSHDSVPVAGRVFLECVKLLYRENRLAEGTLRLGGAGVDLKQIDCPLLLLVGTKDHLVPVVATRPVERLVSSDEVRTLEADVGHIGLVVSTKAHRGLWPEAAAWLVGYSSPIPPTRPAPERG
ncbi:MAG: alpha/beta fold hydrolase [Planctomycetota bacterium]